MGEFLLNLFHVIYRYPFHLNPVCHIKISLFIFGSQPLIRCRSSRMFCFPWKVWIGLVIVEHVSYETWTNVLLNALLCPQFLLYCEGTRFTETKHKISMEVADKKGLARLKYHLLPRTRGFTTAVQCLRGTGNPDNTSLLSHILYPCRVCVCVVRCQKVRQRSHRWWSLNPPHLPSNGLVLLTPTYVPTF